MKAYETQKRWRHELGYIQRQFHLAYRLWLIVPNLLFTLYFVILLPLIVAFQQEKISVSITYTVNIVLSISLTVESVVNIKHYGYLYPVSLNHSHTETISTSLAEISLARLWYLLKKGLVFDIVAFFPYEIFYFIDPGYAKYMCLFRILYGGRILRYLKELRNIIVVSIPRNKWNMFVISSSWQRLVLLWFTLWVILHLVSCLWFMIASDSGRNSWQLEQCGAGFDCDSAFAKYTLSLHWALTTFSTVGFGDIIPSASRELLYTILVQLAGVTYCAVVMAAVTAVLLENEASASSFESKTIHVNEFLDRIPHLSIAQKKQVMAFYEYRWHQFRGSSERVIINDLPKSLRVDIIDHLAGDLLRSFPYFAGMHSGFISSCLASLRPCLYPPSCVVVTYHEPIQHLYFILQGVVEEVEQTNFMVVRVLTKGEVFGETSVRCLRLHTDHWSTTNTNINIDTNVNTGVSGQTRPPSRAHGRRKGTAPTPPAASPIVIDLASRKTGTGPNMAAAGSGRGGGKGTEMDELDMLRRQAEGHRVNRKCDRTTSSSTNRNIINSGHSNSNSVTLDSKNTYSNINTSINRSRSDLCSGKNEDNNRDFKPISSMNSRVLDGQRVTDADTDDLISQMMAERRRNSLVPAVPLHALTGVYGPVNGGVIQASSTSLAVAGRQVGKENARGHARGDRGKLPSEGLASELVHAGIVEKKGAETSHAAEAGSRAGGRGTGGDGINNTNGGELGLEGEKEEESFYVKSVYARLKEEAVRRHKKKSQRHRERERRMQRRRSAGNSAREETKREEREITREERKGFVKEEMEMEEKTKALLDTQIWSSDAEDGLGCDDFFSLHSSDDEFVSMADSVHESQDDIDVNSPGSEPGLDLIDPFLYPRRNSARSRKMTMDLLSDDDDSDDDAHGRQVVSDKEEYLIDEEEGEGGVLGMGMGSSMIRTRGLVFDPDSMQPTSGDDDDDDDDDDDEVGATHRSGEGGMSCERDAGNSGDWGRAGARMNAGAGDREDHGGRGDKRGRKNGRRVHHTTHPSLFPPTAVDSTNFDTFNTSHKAGLISPMIHRYKTLTDMNKMNDNDELPSIFSPPSLSRRSTKRLVSDTGVHDINCADIDNANTIMSINVTNPLTSLEQASAVVAVAGVGDVGTEQYSTCHGKTVPAGAEGSSEEKKTATEMIGTRDKGVNDYGNKGRSSEGSARPFALERFSLSPRPSPRPMDVNQVGEAALKYSVKNSSRTRRQGSWNVGQSSKLGIGSVNTSANPFILRSPRLSGSGGGSRFGAPSPLAGVRRAQSSIYFNRGSSSGVSIANTHAAHDSRPKATNHSSHSNRSSTRTNHSHTGQHSDSQTGAESGGAVDDNYIAPRLRHSSGDEPVNPQSAARAAKAESIFRKKGRVFQFTYTAVTFCEVFALEVSHLESHLARYPHDYVKIIRAAAKDEKNKKKKRLRRIASSSKKMKVLRKQFDSFLKEKGRSEDEVDRKGEHEGAHGKEREKEGKKQWNENESASTIPKCGEGRFLQYKDRSQGQGSRGACGQEQELEQEQEQELEQEQEQEKEGGEDTTFQSPPKCVDSVFPSFLQRCWSDAFSFPDSDFRFVWNVLSAVSLSWYFYALPYNLLIFANPNISNADKGSRLVGETVIDTLCDVFFAVDMIMRLQLFYVIVREVDARASSSGAGAAGVPSGSAGDSQPFTRSPSQFASARSGTVGLHSQSEGGGEQQAQTQTQIQNVSDVKRSPSMLSRSGISPSMVSRTGTMMPYTPSQKRRNLNSARGSRRGSMIVQAQGGLDLAAQWHEDEAEKELELIKNELDEEVAYWLRRAAGGRRLVTNSKEICRLYLQGWFMIDLISVLPYDLLSLLIGEHYRPLLRIPHLLRLLWFQNYFNSMVQYFHLKHGAGSITAKLIQIIYTFALLVALIYLLAFFFSLSAFSQDPELGMDWRSRDPGKDTLMLGLDGTINMMMRAVYFVISAMTTIGSGDIRPVGYAEIGVSMVCMSVGMFVIPTMVGLLTAAAQNLDAVRNAFDSKTSLIRYFLTMQSMPASIREEIMSYYSLHWDQHRIPSSVISDAPLSLRKAIMVHQLGDLSLLFSFLKGCSKNLIEEFTSTMNVQVYPANTTIMKRGQANRHIYHLLRGSVRLMEQSVDGSVALSRTLKPGATIGQTSFISNRPHKETAITESVCHVVIGTRSALKTVLSRYPSDWYIIKSNMKVYEAAMKMRKQVFRRQTTHQSLHEDQDEAPIDPSIRLPDSTFRRRWDLFCFLMCTYYGICLPFRFTFYLDAKHMTAGLYIIYVLDYLCLFGFCVDMYFRLRVFARYHSTTLITNKAHITQLYLRTWDFSFQMMALLPWDLAALYLGRNALVMLEMGARLPLFMRLPYYLRASLEMISNANHTHANLLRSGVLVGVILFITHLFACFWFFLAYDGWLHGHFGAMHLKSESWVVNDELELSSVWVQYMRAFYWALGSNIVVFSGDIVPTTFSETFTMTFVLLVGIPLYATFVSNFAAIITHSDSYTTEFSIKKYQVSKFAKHSHLPAQLKQHINDYYEHIRTQRRSIEDGHVIQLLPPWYRARVARHLVFSVIECIAMFDGCSGYFLDCLLELSEPLLWVPNQMIFRQGEVSVQLFLFYEGVGEVVYLRSEAAEATGQGAGEKADRQEEGDGVAGRSAGKTEALPGETQMNASVSTLDRSTADEEDDGVTKANQALDKSEDETESMVGERAEVESHGDPTEGSDPLGFPAILEAGDYYGADGLITHTKHKFSLRAHTFMQAFVLHSSRLFYAFKTWPEQRKLLLGGIADSEGLTGIITMAHNVRLAKEQRAAERTQEEVRVFKKHGRLSTRQEEDGEDKSLGQRQRQRRKRAVKAKTSFMATGTSNPRASWALHESSKSEVQLGSEMLFDDDSGDGDMEDNQGDRDRDSFIDGDYNAITDVATRVDGKAGAVPVRVVEAVGKEEEMTERKKLRQYEGKVFVPSGDGGRHSRAAQDRADSSGGRAGLSGCIVHTQVGEQVVEQGGLGGGMHHSKLQHVPAVARAKGGNIQPTPRLHGTACGVAEDVGPEGGAAVPGLTAGGDNAKVDVEVGEEVSRNESREDPDKEAEAVPGGVRWVDRVRTYMLSTTDDTWGTLSCLALCFYMIIIPFLAAFYDTVSLSFLLTSTMLQYCVDVLFAVEAFRSITNTIHRVQIIAELEFSRRRRIMRLSRHARASSLQQAGAQHAQHLPVRNSLLPRDRSRDRESQCSDAEASIADPLQVPAAYRHSLSISRSQSYTALAISYARPSLHRHTPDDIEELASSGRRRSSRKASKLGRRSRRAGARRSGSFGSGILAVGSTVSASTPTVGDRPGDDVSTNASSSGQSRHSFVAYASKPPSVLAASRPRLSLGNAKWTSHGSDVSFVRAGLTKNMTTGAESGAGAGAGAGTGAGAGERASFRSRQSRGSSVLSLASGEGRHSAVELKYLASRSNNTKWSGHIIDTNDRDLCPSQEDAHWSEPQPSSGGDIAEDIAESGDGPHHADRGHDVNNKSSRPRDSQAVWEHRGSNASEDSFVAGTDSDGEDGVYASRMRDTCRACCGWNWSLWSLFIATDNEHVRALLLLQTKRLWIQLLGCLPFDLLLYLLLLDQDYETRYVLGIINIFRLHKLIRLVDLHGYMARLESLLRVDDASMRVVRLFLAYVFFIHWFGCSWYAIAKHEQQEESWNTFISDDISDDDAFFWWLRSVYWASTVISTTGYGDIVPRTSWETILAILIAITGAMLLAVLVGAFTSVLSYYDAASSVFQQRRERMNHYMDYRDLPSSLRERADAYYDYVWETDGGAELGDILKELPRSLRHEVVYFHVAFILEKVPLFAGFESGFLASIINVLYPITVPPKDDIIRKGETSQDMYFIHSGHVVVYDPDSAFSNSVVNVKRILRPGAFFGELGLISQQRRSISVRCGKYDFSQLFVLSKKGIDHVMLYYPEYKDVLKQNILKHTSLYKDGNEDGFFDLMK